VHSAKALIELGIYYLNFFLIILQS